MQAAHSDDDMRESVLSISARFDVMSTARDDAVTLGRNVIRLSANAIRAMHRREFDDANTMLASAQSTLNDIRRATESWPQVYWAGYTQDAMKEFAEASITAAILQHQPAPGPEALSVEDAAWLNGFAEAASELRRDTLDALRAGDIAQAESLLETMDRIQGHLVTVDFPDAVTGGLRRTTDQLRAVLERTRGDVTMAVRQDRLEQSLRTLEHGGS